MELLTVNLLLFFICTSKPLYYTLDDREQKSLNLAMSVKVACNVRKHENVVMALPWPVFLASTKKLNLTFSYIMKIIFSKRKKKR